MDEFIEEKRFVEEEEPYWMNLRGGTAFFGELRYELENYFPEAHYKKAIDQAFQEVAEEELMPDGGSRSQYYWSGEQGLLYHTESESEFVDPFFDTIDEAERYLENKAPLNGKEPTKE